MLRRLSDHLQGSGRGAIILAIMGSVAAAIAGLILPYFSTWYWFRVAHPSASAGLLQLFGPAAIVAICAYLALMQWHARLSNFTVDILA